MTFIASVIAKNGVALIADSLVTTTVPSIQIIEFTNFLKEKAEATTEDEIKLTPEEIINLFKSRPSHTKDFEEKLFKFDEYTAITTAGSATINNKRINTIIEEVKALNKKDTYYSRKSIQTKIKILSNYIENEIKIHLANKTSIRPTTFILTHYDKKIKKTQIFKINVNTASQDDLTNKKFKFLTIKPSNEWEKVVCDGQNRISERILLGGLDDIYSIIPKITFKIIKDFKIKKTNSEIIEYVNKVKADTNIFSDLFNEMKIFKLSELSLQQAVDLANLLMKIEIDFQIYTENIPTVGGVIKIATIDENGFKYVSGHEILKPI